MADPTTETTTTTPPAATDVPAAVDTTTTTTVDAGASPPPAGEDKLTIDEKAVAAFDKGVNEQRAIDTGTPVEKVETPPAEVKKPENDGKADGGKTPAKETEGKTPADERAAAIETEIKALGLKEKTAERFRELSKRPSEQEIAPLREKAERFERELANWNQIITESTARPDQLSSALGYVQAINSGDPVRMGKAYDVMVQEVAWLGKQLGREVPGAYDPLADHGDLRQKVEQGDMTRESALEVARHRAVSARTADLTKAQQDEQKREADHNAAVDSAMKQVATLNAKLKAADPHFAAKLPALKPMLDMIRETIPPAQWAAAVERAYLAIPAPAPAATTAPPPVGTVPLRPTGGSGTPARKFNADEVNRGDPFTQGVASVGR